MRLCSICGTAITNCQLSAIDVPKVLSFIVINKVCHRQIIIMLCSVLPVPAVVNVLASNYKAHIIITT